MNFTLKKGPVWEFNSGYGNDINSVSVSADGEYTVIAGRGSASGGGSGKLKLFKGENGTPVWTFTADSDSYFESVDISADGEYIAAGTETFGDDNTCAFGFTDCAYVYLFDKDSSTALWKKTVYGKVNEVSISEDGEYIIAATDGNRFYVYDKSGDLVWNYANKDFNLGEISADGKYAVGAEYTSGQKGFIIFQ